MMINTGRLSQTSTAMAGHVVVSTAINVSIIEGTRAAARMAIINQLINCIFFWFSFSNVVFVIRNCATETREFPGTFLMAPFLVS